MAVRRAAWSRSFRPVYAAANPAIPMSPRVQAQARIHLTAIRPKRGAAAWVAFPVVDRSSQVRTGAALSCSAVSLIEASSAGGLVRDLARIW